MQATALLKSAQSNNRDESPKRTDYQIFKAAVGAVAGTAAVPGAAQSRANSLTRVGPATAVVQLQSEG